MADSENTNMEPEEKEKNAAATTTTTTTNAASGDKQPQKAADGVGRGGVTRGATAEYCEQLQAWMWNYYTAYVNWQSWLAVSSSNPYYYLPPPGQPHAAPPPLDSAQFDAQNWYNNPFGLPLSPLYPPPAGVGGVPGAGGSSSSTPAAGGAAGPIREGGGLLAGGGGAAAAAAHHPTQQLPQENGNVQRPGREYNIPSPLQRLLAEMVDFFILFFIKATIIISIMHLSGMKDISKFAMHFIVEEIDEDTSMEELQKMMLVALVYRILVCFYEIVCIWGAGGATPGKFLVGLRVVTCDSSVLVQPNRVLVIPANNVSLSASTVRALNKNFSIAFFFPAFITLLFFQHNRTVYDMVAGTIVVKRAGAR